jgi:FtsZ-binding cell division protein ZapB
MAVKEFIDWALKTGPLDWDKAYSAQCVDLFRFFHNKCVNSSNQPKSVVGAKNFWTNYESDPVLNQNYTKIENTPSYVPKEGDVIIWRNGDFGHIAIATGSGDTNKFKSLDQNWTGKNEIAIVEHTYGYVYGGLRPKLLTTQETMTYTEEEMTKVRLERDSNWTKYQTELENVKKLTSENKGLKEERDSIKKKYNSLIEYIFSKINPLKPLIDQSEDSAKAEIVSLVSNIDILNKEIKDTQNEANDKETKLIKENEVLQGKLDTLQTQFDKLKENHASELEAMQAKIDKVQAQVDANSKTKQENNTIMTWIENIIKKLKG